MNGGGYVSTFRGELLVGSRPYQAIVTNDLEVAVAWVRGLLPLDDPSLMMFPRVFGFSFHWSTEDDGRRALDSIHLSFVSTVLVLHLNGLGPGAALPETLAGFLRDPRNLFVGVEVTVASEMLRRAYGVRMPWKLDLGIAAALFRANGGLREGLPHVVLSRGVLGFQQVRLAPGDGMSPWTAWPPSVEQVKFAVESSVRPQLIWLFLMHHDPLYSFRFPPPS